METQINTLICFLEKKAVYIITMLIGKPVSISFFTLAISASVYGQESIRSCNTTIGLSMANQVSANGYGCVRMPGLFIKKGRGQLAAGVAFQKCRSTVTGIQLNYGYSVTGPNVSGSYENGPELYFFASAAYNYNSRLGKRILWEENMANPNATETHVSSLSFSSAEVFGGAGLRVKFLERFKWDNSIGLGFYTSFDYPANLKLYYCKSGVGLQLRTSISFIFFKK